METIIQFLLENGFQEDGSTSISYHGVKTYDDTKPRIAVVGGRIRLKRENCFVTVGKRTTCVYKKEHGTISVMENFPTKEIEKIKQYILNQI